MAASEELGPKGRARTRPRSNLLVVIRFAFGFLTIVALVTGYLGLRQFLGELTPAQLATLGTGWRDILYYDLQLFVLSSQPLELRPNYPLLLDIARFAAPAATALALVEAAHAIFAGQYHRWRDRNRLGHSIVIGDTAVARALVAELRRSGERVDWLVEGSAEELIAAGVRGAAVVYACADDTQLDDPGSTDLLNDSTRNVAIAQTAATVMRSSRARGPLQVYAQVTDPMLALGLRARWLGQKTVDRARVDFFTVDVLAARACLRDADVPQPVDNADPPAITIAGWGTFGRALLVEYAQRWQVRSAGRAGRIRVTVVGATPAEILDVASRWDVIDEMCDVRAVTEVDAPWLTDQPLPYRTFICYEDEKLALNTALTAARLWRGGPDSVVLRLSRLALPADPTEATPADSAGTVKPSALKLIDDIGGCLRIVSVTAIACRPEVLKEDIVERLAQSIHLRYLYARSTEGTLMHATNAMRWWDKLDENFRNANRHPARDIGNKLSLIPATVAPRTAAAIPFRLTPAELERLALVEHDRWMAERRGSGWRYGSPRDDARKLHPSLIPWAELPESEREKDRDAVRELPRVLAEAGLQIVRLGQPQSNPTGGLPQQVSLNA